MQNEKELALTITTVGNDLGILLASVGSLILTSNAVLL